MSSRPYAIVTGASRGVGAAIALLLAKDGYDIAVNYASGETAAKTTAARISELGFGHFHSVLM